jgi:hypothetical protein
MTEKIVSKYTDVVVAEMVKRAPLTFEICGEIGEKFGLPQRGVAASAKRNGIAYVCKPRVSKTGGTITSKSDLVGMIAGNLGLPASDLDGLEKSTKTSLEAVAIATFENLDCEVEDEDDPEG